MTGYNPGAASTYAYDAFGRRVRAATPAGTFDYFYDVNGALRGVWNDTNERWQQLEIGLGAGTLETYNAAPPSGYSNFTYTGTSLLGSTAFRYNPGSGGIAKNYHLSAIRFRTVGESSYGTSPPALNADNFFGVITASGGYNPPGWNTHYVIFSGSGISPSLRWFLHKYGPQIDGSHTAAEFTAGLNAGPLRYNNVEAKFPGSTNAAIQAILNRINCPAVKKRPPSKPTTGSGGGGGGGNQRPSQELRDTTFEFIWVGDSDSGGRFPVPVSSCDPFSGIGAGPGPASQ